MYTEEQKADIALVMRQTGCLDVKKVAECLVSNNGDVLCAVCELMQIEGNKSNVEPRCEEQKKFDEMREILQSKYDMFYDIMKQQKSQGQGAVEDTSK